jgi:hypothetical protein
MTWMTDLLRDVACLMGLWVIIGGMYLYGMLLNRKPDPHANDKPHEL